MNEAPFAFPVELCEHLDSLPDISIEIASFYDNHANGSTPAGVPIHGLGANSRHDLGAWNNFRNLLKSGEYHVLHTHPNTTGTVARLITSVASPEVTIIDTKHNDHGHFSLVQRLPNAVGNVVCDAIITNSENTLRSLPWYETEFIPRHRRYAISNGVNPERIRTAAEADAPIHHNGPTLVSVGRHVRQKDYPTLIRAMQTVSEEVDDVKLFLVGTGSQHDDLVELVETLSLGDVIEFTGYLDARDDVYAMNAAADLWITPSRYEGFCVAAVEAMAVGTPVLVSDIPVLREVIGEDGLYAQPGSSTEFAQQIIEALDDEQELQRRGDVLSERVDSKYSLDLVAERHANIYESVVKGP